MGKYFTGLISTDYPHFPKPPYKGRQWLITLETTEKSKRTTAVDSVESKMKLIPGKELVIHASSLESAIHVAYLLNAAETLLDAQSLAWSLLADVGPWPIPEDQTELRGLSIVELARHGKQNSEYYGRDDFPLCALIAGKASHRRAVQYALFKYLLSHYLVSVDIMSLQPDRGQHAFRPKPYTLRHVCYAQSIVTGFSVLEDLGLTVRASQEKPSLIKGKWNTEILQDLQQRLVLAGVNLHEDILWLDRGRQTKIERERPLKGTKLASYVRNGMRDVKDFHVSVVDAINYASWLRSRVAAHKLGALASELTPIHAVNVQHLARRMLLEKLGIWRTL